MKLWGEVSWQTLGIYHQIRLGSAVTPVFYTAPLSVACIICLFLLTFAICCLVSHKTFQTFFFVLFNPYPCAYQYFFFPYLAAATVPALPGGHCIPTATSQTYHCLLCLTEWVELVEASSESKYKSVLSRAWLIIANIF